MTDDRRYRVDPELLDERDEEMDADLPDELEADDGGGAFHDPVLRRALLHAPDHAVSPMEETRESILSFAHEAVAPSLAAAPVWAQRSFVQRLLGMRGGAGFSAHIPWNGLVVIALVAAAVFVRDRDLLDDFRTKVARKKAAEPSAAASPASEIAKAPAPAPASPAVPLAQAPQTSAQTIQPVAPPPPPPPPSAVVPPAVASVPAAAASLPAQPAAMPAAAPTIAPAAPTIAMPAVESPKDAAARIALEQKLQRFEAAEAKARLAQRSDASGAQSSLFASALPRMAIPVEVPMASRAGRAGTTAQPEAGLPASQAPSRVEEPPTPTFTALSQWTRLTITSAGGETRRVARADARELGPLVGSAALAGVGPQPLSGRVEWRIALERNGEQLGLLEVAGNQIRWKEKGIPAGTGAPAASGLTSLREALKEAEAEPVKAAEPAPAQ
ncbi:hypothetical protein ACSFA3_09875 [Variovorax sp. RHLX14]|uniref:hypothetical protein n=1 Tax=Variovorax sp. RHLX14 TaxID=1259731 RepID=UPI003F48518D